jgi:PAS domain S-box-containing protein
MMLIRQWFQRSLTHKLMALFLAVFFCAVWGLTYFAYTSSRNAMYQEFQIRGRMLAQTIASQTRVYYREQDIDGLTSLLHSLGEGEDIVAILAYHPSKALWLEFSGIQLTPGDLNFPDLGDAWQREMVLQRGYHISEFGSLVLDSSQRNNTLVTQSVGAIRIFLDRNALEQRLNVLVQQTMATSLFTLLLGGGLFIILLRRSLQVITPLTDATKKVAEGDLHAAVPVSSSDELGELAKCFNSMTEQLLQTTVSKNYVDNIIHSMTDILIVLNPDGTIRSANRAALNLLGYEQNELLGQYAAIIFLPNENPLSGTTYHEILAQGLIDQIATTCRAKDGRAISVLLSAAAMRNDDRSVQGIACVAKDITERKHAEKSLIESKEYNRTLFELSPIGLALFTMDGTVTDCNEAYAAITGRTREETIGLTYWELTPNEYDGAAKEIMATLTKTGSFQHYEKHYYHRDGRLVPVRLFGNLIKRDNDLYIFCSVEDITARRQAEKALRTAHQKLTELNESRSHFFADISHELRTPLTVIRGEAEVTLRGKNTPTSEYRTTLERIVQLTNQMNKLVGDLLFLARSESGTLQITLKPMSLLTMLNEVCQEANILAQSRSITVTFEGPSHHGINQGDPERLKQLFLILTDNAIKYGRKGGTIVMRMETTDVDTQVSVTDDGIGIPAEDLPHVFERAYRAWRGRPSAVGGAGLGLPIAKWIAEAHQGTISIASLPDRGTTVTVRLPFAKSATSQSRNEADQSSHSS